MEADGGVCHSVALSDRDAATPHPAKATAVAANPNNERRLLRVSFENTTTLLTVSHLAAVVATARGEAMNHGRQCVWQARRGHVALGAFGLTDEPFVLGPCACRSMAGGQ